MDNSNVGMGGKTVLITGGTSRIEATLAINHLAPFLRSPELGAVSGECFLDRQEIEVQEIAYDPEARRRMWKISEELTGPKVAA